MVRTKLRYAAMVCAITGLALTACSDSSDGDDDRRERGDFQTCMVTDAAGVEDGAVNQAAWTGLTVATGERPDLLASPRNMAAGPENDPVAALTGFVTEGCDLILAVGSALADATAQVAAAHPDQQFVLVDAEVEADNVYSIRFDTTEIAFVAGFLAAAHSSTGVVAVYGGADVPEVTGVMDRFADGVAYYNQSRDGDVRLLGWDPERETGTFVDDPTDPAAGRAMADSFAAEQADVILALAPGAGLGTVQAAADSGEFAVIWTDVDGCESLPDYCGVFLTSLVKELPRAVRAAVLEAATSGGALSGGYVGELRNTGVSLAPYHEFEDDLGPVLITDMIDLQADIADGTIELP